MPQVIKKERRCIKCGKMRQINMYPQIDAMESPELKEAILSEKLFDFTCSSCGFNADYAYPVLYHDREKAYMIYYTQNPGVVNESRLPIYLKQVKKRVVTGIKELKEKIIIFDGGYNDVAMEMVKSAMQKILVKKYNDNNTRVFFVRGDEASLTFAIYFSDSKDAVYQSANIKLYKQALELLENSGYKEKNAFINVDKAFAVKLISELK